MRKSNNFHIHEEYNDIFPTPKKLNKAYIKIGLVTGLMTLGLLNFKKTSIFLIILMNLAPLGAMKVAEKGTKLQKRIIVGGTIMMLWTLVSISSTNSSYSSSESKSNTITTDSGKTITREELQKARIACKKLIRASGSKDTSQCWKYSDQ